ncbi:hypothetical protein EJ07DRAFT_111878 [Lizonia empirigonia]|nr:hypothetical protein EJ07DRAFT_111878 [Lizonia empirigonia]
MDAYRTTYTVFKLLLPVKEGYAIRNDIVQRRFLTCELADKVGDFTTPRQPIQPFDCTHHDEFHGILHIAVAAILVHPLPGLYFQLVESALSLLESEVSARLSFPWISPSPLPKLRIAVLEGRGNPIVAEAAGAGMYRAAHALGIDLVILERDVAWARKYATDSGCNEFLACDMTLDGGLSDRVVDALSRSRGSIDGITTFNDYYIVEAAEAAKRLSLSTNPVEALELCHDKGKMRDAIMTEVTLSVSGVAGLKARLKTLNSPLEYPLVIKPVVGCASDGVRKITSEEELLRVLQHHETDFPGVDALIEPYVSGPEVDVNIVLWDGQNIWSEVVDDLPSSADVKLSSHATNETSSALPQSFAETSDILPSVLPASECSLLQSFLTKTLLSLGLKNGVFHVEARVKDSTMTYAMTDRGMQLIDSPGQAECSNKKPSVFLIEINARLPGHQESYSVEYTYGIDYFALHMLMALARERIGQPSTDRPHKDVYPFIHALCQPLEPAARHATHIVYVTANCGGTFATTKPLPEPLASYITHSTVYKQNGDVLGDPFTEGRWHFLAYFGVTARCGGETGRDLVSGIGEIVRRSFEYEVL